MGAELGSFEITRVRVEDAIGDRADSQFPRQLVDDYRRDHHVPLQVYSILYEVFQRYGDKLVAPDEILETHREVFSPEKGFLGRPKLVTVDDINKALSGLYAYGFVSRMKESEGWEWRINHQEPTAPEASATPPATA